MMELGRYEFACLLYGLLANACRRMSGQKRRARLRHALSIVKVAQKKAATSEHYIAARRFHAMGACITVALAVGPRSRLKWTRDARDEARELARFLA